MSINGVTQGEMGLKSAEEAKMFEAVQFIELRDEPEPRETVLGQFEAELDAVESAREAKKQFFTTGSDNYAWWIVRKKGARLANFIADSKSDKEFVLDLSSGELVEVPT
ncbi:MAG: hypothetical protein ACRDU9_11190 [Acidimicrobiia bacterium]